MDPITSVAAGISSSFRLLEVTYQLKAVGEQVTDLLSTTRHVDTNLNEARRLRRLKENSLNNGERSWIDKVLNDTDAALRAVAKLIEPARVDDLTKNSINLGNRVMWVFRDNPQVKDKHARLSICHQSLTAVISCLYTRDAVHIEPVSERKKQKPPPYDPQMEQLLNWQDERRKRKSCLGLVNERVERPMSPSSTSTYMTMTTSSTIFDSPAESIDAWSENLASLATAISNPTTRSADSKEPLIQWSMSDSSVSDMFMFANPLGLEIGVGAQYGEEKTKHANQNLPIVPEQSQQDQRFSDCQSPHLPSCSNYSTGAFLEATERAFNSGTQSSHSDYAGSLFQVRGTIESAFAGNGNHHESSTHLQNNTNGQVASTAALPLHGVDEQSPALSGNDVLSYGGANNLQVQGQHHLSRPHQPFLAYSPSLPSLTSVPSSTTSQTRGAREYSGYRPLTMPANLPYNFETPIAELPTSPTSPNSECGQLEWDHTRTFEGRTTSDVGTGRPSSVAQNGIRRGGRSWLMFHAARGDLAQSPR